jgi:SOUL heme-binding protein
MRVILAGLLGIIMAGNFAGAETYRGNEMPPYVVEQADDAYELRSYGAHVVAEVTVDGGRTAAISKGFRVLAGYIFGGNATKQKIAMTVPVAQSPADDAQWTVRFMMPAAFDPGTLPAPNDARIRFVDVAPERQVTLQFSGVPGADSLAAKAADLRGWAQARGLAITAGPHYYFYDGPMTLPWNRRNEVAFTIK